MTFDLGTILSEFYDVASETVPHFIVIFAGNFLGPLLFGQLIATGDAGAVAIGFFICAALLAVGGVVELLYGVKARARAPRASPCR